MKMKINLDGVQKTLLIPLWSRAKLSKNINPLFFDPKAVEIVKNLEYDFRKIDHDFPYFSQLLFAVRAKMIDDVIKKFITIYPEATIVNLGAGLDTAFFRVDNGTINWYDLDFPDVIEIRKKLIPETKRSHCITAPITDLKWMREINGTQNGILFCAGGVFGYFKKEIIKKCFSDLADHFPESEIVFDAASGLSNFFSNRFMKHRGMKAPIYFSSKDVKMLVRQDQRIKLVEQYALFSKLKKGEYPCKHDFLRIMIYDIIFAHYLIRLKF